MSYTAGNVIKIERLHRGIKQTTLAKGICSTSYLSRIENNVIIPDAEIISLLLAKLGIEMKVVSLEEESELLSNLFDLYKNSMFQREKEEIIQGIKRFSLEKINFSNLESFYDYNLYMLRLNLFLNNTQEIASLLDILNTMADDFNDKQHFVFNLNRGLYHYLIGGYLDSLTYLELALDYSKKIILAEWELADFHNAISLAYLNTDNNFKALQFSDLALSFFKDNLLFKRAVDSYIVIGISQTELGEHKKAEENFTLALRLLNDDKNIDKVGSVHQNLGYLYALTGDSSKALESYMTSLSFKEKTKTDNIESQLRSILSIIKEYSKLKEVSMVIEWSEKGKRLIGNNQTKLQAYWFHFDIFHALYSDSMKIEKRIVDAISYFEKEKDERHIQKYSIFLGNFLIKKKKYKLASEYLSKSNVILLKQRNLQHWEDL